MMRIWLHRAIEAISRKIGSRRFNHAMTITEQRGDRSLSEKAMRSSLSTAAL